MRKINKNKFFIFTLLICSVISLFTALSLSFPQSTVESVKNAVFADSGETETTASSSGYDITDYDLDIVVNENNVFVITETITVNYSKEKHGIVRYIPEYYYLLMPNGKRKETRAIVSDIKVENDTPYSVHEEDSGTNIRFGSASSTLLGNVTYKFSYNYKIGADTYKNEDYFFFNLIGTDWDTSISNITFKITMPKKFDASKIEFASGKRSASTTATPDFSVSGNVITGRLNETLKAGEAFTIKITLPDGYFKNAGFISKTMSVIYFVVPLIIAGIYLLLAYIYGRNNIVEPITFFPPENLNSLDLAYVYNGYVSNKDIASLIIFLANKGYISIEEKQETTKNGKTKTKFYFNKLKDYDGGDQAEQLVYEGLFYGGKTQTSESDVQRKFYKSSEKIKKTKNRAANYDKYFTNANIWLFFGGMLAIFLLFIWSIAVPFIIIGQVGEFIALAFFFVVQSILFGAFSKLTKQWLPQIILICFMLGFVTAIFFSFNFVFAGSVLSYIAFFMAIAFTVIIYLVANQLNKRTELGAKLLGEIKGFRRFLILAEKPKLEALVEENPNYFYDILPYTYVLGVSNKWIKKFESLIVTPPSWYVGSNYQAFSMLQLNRAINRSMSSASSSYNPSRSSGGSFGGGGFSGGGHGGGGGRSW